MGMLELHDPKWSQLKGNYNDGSRTAALLLKALAGSPLSEWYEDLFQECCHQYTVSEVAYAAAPHLVNICSVHAASRVEVLVLLGSIYTYASSPISPGFAMEWATSAQAAIRLLADQLKEPPASEDELRYLLSALAGLHGFITLARALETLDAGTDLEDR
jgi:hypothetical protein